MPETKTTTTVTSTVVWQAWAKQRRQKAPVLERIHAISTTVQVNVTQLLLDERRGT